MHGKFAVGLFAAIGAVLSLTSAPAVADDADLAKQLANPIGSLISVPFQFNYDTGYGSENGEKAFVNVQPVIPFSLSEHWNVISRTIVPIAWQDNISGFSENGRLFGDFRIRDK